MEIAICIIPLAIIVIVILVVNDRMKERAVRKAETAGRIPPRRYLSYQTSWGFLAFLVVGLPVLVALFYFTASPPGTAPPTQPDSVSKGFPSRLYFGGATFVGIFVYVLVASRWRDRDFLRAARLARRGKFAEAISCLDEFETRRGRTAITCNNRAVYLGQMGQWKDSLAAIEEAIMRGGAEPVFESNKGLALAKLGRLIEALPLVENAFRRLPRHLYIMCNYGSILADLGRVDEAFQLLRTADNLFATQWSFSSRRERERILEEYRRKVTTARRGT